MEHILSNKEIVGVLELAPYNGGEDVCFMGEEVKAAAGSVDCYIQSLDSAAARIAYAMRTLYLLGVQRGAEAYRNEILDSCEPLPDVPYTPCEGWEADVVADLCRRKPAAYDSIFRPFGFTFTEKGEITLV